MSKKLALIIVNWNNEDVIGECLRSVGIEKNVDIVVVDQGSGDRSVERIKKEFPHVHIIELGENRGYAGGNNAGIRYSMEKGYEYIGILNPDTVIHPGCLRTLCEAIQKDTCIGIVGPKIYGRDTTIWAVGGWIDRQRYSAGLIGYGEKDTKTYDKIRDVDYIPGTCMVIRRDVFDHTGLLYDPYFSYYEDVDLCLSAQEAGYRTVVIPHAVIDHLESTSFGTYSPRQQYYLARNHLIFVGRHAPWKIKLREMIRLPRTFWEHIQKKEWSAGMGIWHMFLGKRGMWEGGK